MVRRWVTRAAQAAGLLLLVAALWRGWLEVTGNFHEVRAALLYARPSCLRNGWTGRSPPTASARC